MRVCEREKVCVSKREREREREKEREKERDSPCQERREPLLVHLGRHTLYYTFTSAGVGG